MSESMEQPSASTDPKPARGRGRSPLKLVVGLVIVLVVLGGAAGLIAIALAGGSGAKTRTFNASLTSLPLAEPTSVQASGVLHGTPLGRVEVIFVRQLVGTPSTGGKAVRFGGTMLLISPSGDLALTVLGVP